MYQIINGAPPPLTSVRADVPMDLERIVNKCLEKNRDERYQTAADLIADLEHLQSRLATGTQVTQSSMTSAAGRSSTHKRKWAYWAAPVIVLATVGSVLFIKMSNRATPTDMKVVPVGTSTPQGKSIAVLPFVDMSPAHNQEYFCDGMTEELINRLVNIQGLRVPARTSAFMFKGRTEDIRDVGRRLNVGTVLEGSVRKAGDRLRITAQLINVADGYHIWSKTFDGDLKDVFAVQDEISSAIANALELQLTPQERQMLSARPIDNVKTYEYYLKADREVMRFDETSLDRALEYLQTAIDIMGENAVLYSAMANVYSQYANIGKGQEYFEKSREYAEKALALQPDLPSALTRLGSLAYYQDYPKNLHDAFYYFGKALAVNPNEVGAIERLVSAYQAIGRLPEAAVLLDRMERQDPLNPWRHANRGWYCISVCEFECALEQTRLHYESDSVSPLSVVLYSSALAYSGKREEAVVVIDQAAQSEQGNMMVVFSLLLKCGVMSDAEGAVKLLTPDLREICMRDLEWSYWVAERLSLAGARPEALEYLENAIDRGFVSYPFMQCDPFLDNIRGEERFEKLMKRAKYEWEHFEVPG